ncbi:hypothetical protein N7474_002588 [Penicillium riverlandense]|uniref:uncharacterized protein n=1 Tax=Penicillium riverlandense TaxID=1903569 RepID=UPI002548F1A5|nr:uncharacterized protein N7474_002588 [Penicillium riverlandense]KAJ5825450.1 hypothetical protein N7474_002588 [Penicillium riverlandense]
MPRLSATLQAPDHPIALQPTHLLASMPDLQTDSATTLIITRGNTLFGPDYLVNQLRWHKSPHSRQRQSLLFTVNSKFWRKSQHRIIRDASGRPLLELRRQWRQRIWRVMQAGGGGDELLSANMSCALEMKMLMQVTNALLAASHLDESHQQQLQQHAQFQASRRPVASQRPANRTLPPQEQAPPPYSAVIAGNTSDYFASSNNSNTRGLAMDDNSLLSLDDEDDTSTSPPSYESIRPCPSHSLQDLLDAVEAPREPAPSPFYDFPPGRWHTGAAVNKQEELEVLRLSNTVTTVMMGDRTIIGIRRGKMMNYHSLSGALPRWEVQIAEGVDLLLVSFLLVLNPTTYLNRLPTSHLRRGARRYFVPDIELIQG